MKEFPLDKPIGSEPSLRPQAQAAAGEIVIPAELKIGGHWVSVSLVPPRDLGQGIAGEVRWSQCTIRLAEDISPSAQAETLLHEIIEMLSATHELELEHHKLTSLSQGLFQVLVDNPQLRKSFPAGRRA